MVVNAPERISNRRSITQHWIHWILNLIAAIVIGVLLIPMIRSHPVSIHEFALKLPDWQRHLLIFAVAVLFLHVIFQLFAPRLSHLKYFRTHPPTWLAWTVSGVVLWIVDLF